MQRFLCRLRSASSGNTWCRRALANKAPLTLSSSTSQLDKSRALALAKKTPLFPMHEAYKGKMIGFAGWKLPLHFPSGVLTETRHTRAAASLFDVCHMQQLRVSGADAVAYLESICVSNVDALQLDAGHYSLLTNENGGIIDDICSTKQSP